METDAGDELELELGTDGAIAMLSIAKEDRFPGHACKLRLTMAITQRCDVQ